MAKPTPQQVYNYLMTKPGMTDVKARGIIANIQAESGFDPAIRGDYMIANPTGELKNKERLVYKKIDGKYYYMNTHPTKAGQEVDENLVSGIEATAGGLFQHQSSRYNAMVAEVGDDWETNWKGQVDFALSEPDAQKYLDEERTFNSVTDSTKAFMLEFERPADQSDKKVDERVSNAPEVLSNLSEGQTIIPQDIELQQDNTQIQSPPVPVIDDLIVDESEGDRRKREKLQEEDERISLRANEREKDAKRYMELTRKKKEAVEYYGKDAKRAKRFDEELAEIEKKYNLTPARSDEDLEKIRLETINQILDDPETRGAIYTDQDLVDIEEEEPNIEDNFLVTDTDVVVATDEEQVTTDTREPTVEEVETRHGPNARIGTVGGVDNIIYTDENGDPQQYPVSEFYNEENTQTFELYDDGTLPPPQNIPVTNDDIAARQDNTLGPTITPVELQVEEGEGTEGIDPSFIPNEQTPLVANANDTDGDGVPDGIDPDSETVQIVDTDFTNTNNNENNNQINYLDSLGDLGNVLSQGLGIVQSVRDMIGNPDDLMMTALGKKAYAEAMKEIKPADYPGLSAQFKDHLNQTRQLAKMGFSLDESQKAKADIDAAYGKGIENAVRGTAGNRAKFLAMSGVLDSQRQSALLDFAAKDAALQRQNQTQYLKALSFSEEYELNKTKAERAEELQLTLQQKKGASEFAKTVFAQISQNNANKRLAPVLNRYKNELLSGMSGGRDPYTLTSPNITRN